MPIQKRTRACKHCGRSQQEVRLEKCVICHGLFCRPCGMRRHGKIFCGKACAEVFFFGAGDEEER